MPIDFTTLPLDGDPGRANAIRRSLIEIAALPNADVDIDSLQGAFEALSASRVGDDGPTSSRRQTCRDIAAGIRAGFAHNGGQWALPGGAHRAAPWFQAQIDAWGCLTPEQDGRRAAMAATARRELAELRAYISGRDQ